MPFFMGMPVMLSMFTTSTNSSAHGEKNGIDKRSNSIFLVFFMLFHKKFAKKSSISFLFTIFERGFYVSAEKWNVFHSLQKDVRIPSTKENKNNINAFQMELSNTYTRRKESS